VVSLLARRQQVGLLTGHRSDEAAVGDVSAVRLPLPPRAANHVWACDFVFDACANGQKLKSLSVVDELTREWLAIDVAGSDLACGATQQTLVHRDHQHGTRI
jgi:hypothetical protein